MPPGRSSLAARAVLGLALALGQVFATLLSYGAASDDFVVRGWQSEDGLPESTVSAICQARDGYLWLGTYGGLVRFDGIQFALFNHDTAPELCDNNISCLFESEDGTLWIGHGTGELTRCVRGPFESASIPNRQEHSPLLTFAADDAGDLWVFAKNGLLFGFAMA